MPVAGFRLSRMMRGGALLLAGSRFTHAAIDKSPVVISMAG